MDRLRRRPPQQDDHGDAGSDGAERGGAGRGGTHGVDVEGTTHQNRVVAAQGVGASGVVADPVEVAPPDGREPRVETLGRRAQPPDDDVVRQDAAQAGGGTGWFAAPLLQTPAFSWQALIELVVPLAITVLIVQNEML